MPNERQDSRAHLREAELKIKQWAAVVLLLVAAARADDVIAPFLDSQTNGVIYLDFSAIDMGQIDAWLAKVLTTIPNETVRDEQQKDMDEGLGKAKKWISDFRAAGGKDLYVVVSLSGILSGSPGGVVVPLNGTDGTALAKVFPQPNPTPAGMAADSAAQWQRMQAATGVVGKMMVFSTGAGVDRMKTASAQPRQDLLDALSSTSGGAVQIVFNPATVKNNPFFQLILSQNMPPADAGAAPPASPLSDPVWDSVTWVGVSLTAPPKEAGNFTVQCKDADSASEMSDWISQKLKDWKALAVKSGGISGDDYDKLAAIIKPQVKGTQVVVSVDQDAVDNVIGPIFMKNMVYTLHPEAATMPATMPVGATNNGM
jgi:hypothetical protein